MMRAVLWGLLLMILAAAVWVSGPDLVYQGGHPLAGVTARIAAIVVLALLVLLVLSAAEWWQRRRIARRIAALQPARPVQSPAPAPLADALELSIAEAVAWSTQRERRAERLGPGAYAVPWIVVTGGDGADRLAFFEAAGLTFERAAREASAIRFGLAEEGVFIDIDCVAPGQATDQDPWSRLCRAVAKARPRRPLDAVILLVPLPDLLASPAADLVRTPGAATLARMRLQQAMRLLGAQPPLYTALTGCDRLLGFAAALDGMPDTEPLGSVVPERADPPDTIATDFKLLASALSRLLPERLALERDPARRAQAAELPAQIAQLGPHAGQFAQLLLRAGAGDRPIDLRGVFLTAARDEASADQSRPRGPAIDVWAAPFAQALDLRSPSLVPAASVPTFVPGLLGALILAEAGSGGRNHRLERRTVRRTLAGYAAVIGALVLLVALWGASYLSNQQFLQTLGDKAGQLAKYNQAQSGPPAGLAQVLPMLAVARAAASETRQRPLTSDLLDSLLLPPTEGQTAAGRTYAALLVTSLLPVLRQVMADQMRATEDPGQLRELLTLYLETASPARWDPGRFTAWVRTVAAGALPFNPGLQSELRQQATDLVPEMPQSGGLDPVLIQLVRDRLRQVPDPELIYAQLKAIAAVSPEAPPLDVAASLGAAGAQLLLLRLQAGLPSVVPGLYTRSGFYNVYLRRLPGLIHAQAEDAFVMGPSSNGAASDAELQAVTDLYTRDYIQQWRGVLNQIGLQALPDLTSFAAGLQALASPESPIQQLINLVRTHTDLGLPAPAPSGGLLARVAGSGAAAAASQALPASVGGIAGLGAATDLPQGLRVWPGATIRQSFAPIDALGGEPGQASPALRLGNSLAAAFGVVSGIAAAPNPAAAAMQATAAAATGQGADFLAPLRTQSATLPRPLDAIFRDLYTNGWAILRQLSLERLAAAWSAEVAPFCAQSIARRYPFADATAERDVLPRDFATFFGGAGILDKWVTTYLMPFVQVGFDGQLALAARGPARLDLSTEGLDQINRARALRDLFFDLAGNLGVRMAITPRYLDPRAFSSTLVVDKLRLTYRHEPPRPVDLQWTGGEEAGTASVTLGLTNGTNPQVSTAGPWALFRLLDGAETMRVPDGLVIAFTLNGVRAAYELQAASTTNPLVNHDWRSFRCVPRL